MIELESLLNTGALGVIVAWFMFRMERVVKNNTEVLILVKDHMKNGK